MEISKKVRDLYKELLHHKRHTSEYNTAFKELLHLSKTDSVALSYLEHGTPDNILKLFKTTYITKGEGVTKTFQNVQYSHFYMCENILFKMGKELKNVTQVKKYLEKKYNINGIIISDMGVHGNR